MSLTMTPAEVAVLRRRIAQRAGGRNTFARYADDPAGYARDVLGVSWWTKQVEIAEALCRHRRVLVRAAHSIGKTHLTGGIVNWHYDTFDPGITITTAPTERQVNDLLWKEIRVQRHGRPGLMPKAARMESAPDHYAVGFTARDVNAFQGTHEERLLIIFDEAVGVAAEFWEGAEAMLTSGAHNRLLAIYNPTDTASAAYAAELLDDVHVVQISALEHPNVLAELAGAPLPYPKAVRLSWVNERVERWCTPVDAVTATAEDIEWPPGSGSWHKPGPLFEGRVMGRWPSQAVGSVWSEAAFVAACHARLDEPEDVACEIGCDVARQGDDNTVIHVRRGSVALVHESHNGWDTVRTAGRLMELARWAGERCGIDGRRVAIKVDDDGVGGGVTDVLRAEEWAARPVGAGTLATDVEGYPNRRSELWFVVADRARRGELDLSRLPAETLLELRRQLMAPVWKVDSQGRRVVEPKDMTKRRLGRSPDDADALNLAFAFAPPAAAATVAVDSVRAVYGSERRPRWSARR